jgi:hypothetical protein
MEFKITVLPQETKEEIQKFEVSDVSVIKDINDKDAKVVSRTLIYTADDLQANIDKLNAEIVEKENDILYYKEIQSQIK